MKKDLKEGEHDLRILGLGGILCTLECMGSEEGLELLMKGLEWTTKGPIYRPGRQLQWFQGVTT